MVVTVKLLDRKVSQNGSVTYNFDDGTSVEYCSIQDASSDAILTRDRIAPVLSDLLMSLASRINMSGPITATFDDSEPTGAVVRITQ